MVSDKRTSGSVASGSQAAAGDSAPKDTGKAAGEQAGRGRNTGHIDGSDLIRQQMERVAAQKFPGDAARADNFMKQVKQTMAKAEREEMTLKPVDRAREAAQEASRVRDGDRDR